MSSDMVIDQNAFTGGYRSLAKATVYRCFAPSSADPSAACLASGYIASTASLP